MASLGMGLGVVAAGGRAFSRTGATGRNVGGGGGVEEKGPLEWLVGLIQKDGQLLETDPILKKVEDKGRTGGRGTTSVSVPSNGNGKNKFPGLGGLFPKN